MTDNRFYTYAYLRIGDRTPYYIGKGSGKRAYDRSSHRVKVPDNRDRIIFLKENVSEREAWDYETEMIQFYGRKDLGTGILRNLSDGGEGPANPSPEARRRNASTYMLLLIFIDVKYQNNASLKVVLERLHVPLDEVGVVESFNELGNNKLTNIIVIK